MRERRQFVRVPYDEPIQVKSLDGVKAGPEGALARDVSENGVRFVAEQFFPLKSSLLLEMHFPPSLKSVRVVVKPAWVREISDNDRYEVGNTFVEIADADRKIIRQFVCQKTGMPFS